MRSDFLALHRRHFYLAALALATACGRPGATVPAGPFAAVPRESLAALAARTVPAEREVLRIRWRSDDGRIALAGQGAVRVAPPDSLRVDVAVRLGVGRATLILAGEHVAAEPREIVEQVLPDRFALWAALGVIRVPEGVDAVARLEDGARTLWRASAEGGRTTTFELRGDTLVGVTREVDGRSVARLRLKRGPDGRVAKAQVTDLRRGARFEVEITGSAPSEAFPSEIWRLRP